jgi:ferredoxin
MANITFRNPEYKDKTVYAVAGSHTDSLLKLALENRIPMRFDCEDGECGSCLVKVTSLEPEKRMAGPLTDKEVNVLQQLGKISRNDIETMAVDDLPTGWRLACQLIVRDEDLLVEYES